MFDVADLSTKEGHEIGYFSMADERNIPCDQSEYFVPNLDYKNTSLIQKLKQEHMQLRKGFMVR